MKKSFVFLLASFLTLTSFAQNFEGMLLCKNSYKSKNAAVADEQFNAMMGTVQEYYVKDGDYKSITNGSLLQWQLYINKDNKLYNKLSNNETVLWNDAAVNGDEVIKAVINKGVTEVLGYKCDELILTCKTGVQKYYYNAALAVDVSLYVNHKFGNWYEFLSRTKALPLKSIIENEQLIIESVVTEIKPMKLDKTFFELPANIKTMKSPY
ncbi:MAG: hypothetical protein ABIQ88_15685 [Chitinophagaceae bacterium]